MIYVVDAIMGTGKSSAMINYMNTHTEKRYACAVPFLSEIDRVMSECHGRGFVKPERGEWTGDGYTTSKTDHCTKLFSRGKNVILTHANFTYFVPETLKAIKDHHYTLFIDETLSLFEDCGVSSSDMDILVDAGFFTADGDTLHYTGKEYGGGVFSDVIRLARSRELMRMNNGVYCWTLPMSYLRAFDDVFILTYKFRSQVMCAMMQAEGLTWQSLGVRNDGGRYSFYEGVTPLPAYAGHLSDMIWISDHVKLNAIGATPEDGRQRPLTIAAYQRGGTELCERIRKDLHNFAQNVAGARASDVMWSTFSSFEKSIGGNRYKCCFLAHNCRGTNDYHTRTALAYFVNLYMNVGLRQKFASKGVTMSDNEYALSTMIQWIWRSAIRDGKPIKILLPSERMRGLLKQWISDVEHQYAAQQKEVRNEA